MNSKQKILSLFIVCLILLGSFNVRVFAIDPPETSAPVEPMPTTAPAASTPVPTASPTPADSNIPAAPVKPEPTTQEQAAQEAKTAGETAGWNLSKIAGGALGITAGVLASVTIGPAILALIVIAQPIAGLLVMLGGALTNLAVQLNLGLLSDKNSFIQLGWTICRDLTNLGFVLFIIVIAIGNILRVKQYQIKTILWKLIVVALLVNFSLLFTGVFIDFSNMLTNFFIQKASGGNLTGLGGDLMWKLAVQKFQDVESVSGGFWQGLGGSFAGIVTVISGAVFALLFTFLAALCLLAFAVMFFIRFIYLSVLLILLPLACLSWILPVTESLWKKWWSQFFRWVAFAPLASFFIYLAFALVENYTKFIAPMVKSAEGGGSATEAMAWKSVPIAGFFATVSQFVVMIGFLMGGLYAADKMGIHAASTFVGWAEGGAKGIGKWASQTPARTAGRVARFGETLTQKGADWQGKGGIRGSLSGFATKIGAGWQKAADLPGIRRATAYRSPNLFQSVMQGITRQKGKEPESRVQRFRKQIDTLTKQRDSLIKAQTSWGANLTPAQQRRFQSEIDKLDKQIDSLMKTV